MAPSKASRRRGSVLDLVAIAERERASRELSAEAGERALPGVQSNTVPIFGAGITKHSERPKLTYAPATPRETAILRANQLIADLRSVNLREAREHEIFIADMRANFQIVTTSLIEARASLSNAPRASAVPVADNMNLENQISTALYILRSEYNTLDLSVRQHARMKSRYLTRA